MRIRFIIAAMLMVGAAQAQPVVTKFPLNEGTTSTWPIDFYNDATPPVPVVPTTASYQITSLAGSVLVATTPISPLTTHVNVPVAALVFPSSEQVVGNSRLPPAIPVSFTVTYSWGVAQSTQSFVWFSLVNVP